MARIKFTKKDVNKAFADALGGQTGGKLTNLAGKLKQLIGIRKTEPPPTLPIR